MIFVGVDPGLRSGAIAAIDHNGTYVAAEDIVADGVRIDAKKLKEQILRMTQPGDSNVICIEVVGVRPGQGIASSGRFMRAAGAIEAVSSLYADHIEYVLPQQWKKAMGLTQDKEKSLQMGRELFPKAALNLKKHHGRAEALLIAEYARRTFK
jgi:Holliday junction resolvasome RuvABC endonuclease subunit